MAILKASHLKKYYGRDESLVKALDDVSLSVEEGQHIRICVLRCIFLHIGYDVLRNCSVP